MKCQTPGGEEIIWWIFLKKTSSRKKIKGGKFTLTVRFVVFYKKNIYIEGMEFFSGFNFNFNL